MKNKLLLSFGASLFFSVLFYAIPFEVGGNVVRWTTILLSALCLIHALFTARKQVKQKHLFSLVVLLLNIIAGLHLVLIFAMLVLDLGYAVIAVIGTILIIFSLRFVGNRYN